MCTANSGTSTKNIFKRSINDMLREKNMKLHLLFISNQRRQEKQEELKEKNQTKRKEPKKMCSKYKIVTNTVDINLTIPITDLNINGLNKPTVRHRWSEFKKSQEDPNILSIRNPP